jgi:hypothetical protein
MATPRRPHPQPRCCALPDCGQVFTPKRRDARYCSQQCRWVANKRDKRGTAAQKNPAPPPAAIPVTRPAPLTTPAFGLLGSLLPQAPRRPAVPRQASAEPCSVPGDTGTWTDAIAACGWSLNPAAPACMVVDSGLPCSGRHARSIGSVHVCVDHHGQLGRVLTYYRQRAS